MARGSAAVARTGKLPQRAEVRVSTSARPRVKGSAAEDGAAFRRDANDGPMAALSAARDPSPVERMRAVRLSRINHKRSGVYGQIVDTLVNFVYGDGVTVTCKSEAETAFWKRTAEDPENDWDGTLRRKLVGLLIDGEFILSATSPIRGNVNGVPTPSAAVLFGRMEPETVVGVKTRKLNADVVTHLVFKGEDGKPFTLPVLGRGVEPDASQGHVHRLGRRAEDAREVLEVLAHGQVRVDRGRLRDVAHPGAEVRRTGGLAQDVDVARDVRLHAGERSDERGLARSRGPEESYDLTRAQLEGDAAHHLPAAPAHAHVGHRHGAPRGCGSRACCRLWRAHPPSVTGRVPSVAGQLIDRGARPLPSPVRGQ